MFVGRQRLQANHVVLDVDEEYLAGSSGAVARLCVRFQTPAAATVTAVNTESNEKNQGEDQKQFHKGIHPIQTSRMTYH